jgi:hypothetical protein
MTEPKGNVLFVVCTPCEQKHEEDYGVKIAIRSRVGFYEPHTPANEQAKWFAKHAKCGGRANPDHFQLAHLFARNADQEAVPEAVKLALVQ